MKLPEAPSADEVRAALAPLDPQRQKIVVGMLTVMMKEPSRIREREWVAEQLTRVTLLAGEFGGDTPEDAVHTVQEYLQNNAADLLNISLLLFQRVGIDMAPRADSGFTIEDALKCGLDYLPPKPGGARPPAKDIERDLGEQPLARLMAERGLKPSDLVAASTEQVTHKMITRAMKGRRLTANTMGKVKRAWEKAVGDEAARDELFDYEP